MHKLRIYFQFTIIKTNPSSVKEPEVHQIVVEWGSGDS